MLDFKSICALAKCNRRLKGDAESRFALATQGQLSISSRTLELCKTVQSIGLLQYHPKIKVWGPLRVLKEVLHVVIDNIVYLDIINPRIDSTDFDDVLASHIMDARLLEELTLPGCTFTNDTLHSLADGLVKNKSIRSIDLRYSYLGQNPELALSKILCGCPKLTSLNLSDTGIRKYLLEVLATIIVDDRCNLQSLNITNNSFWEIANNSMAFTSMMSKLSKFKALSCRISKEDLRALGDAIGASKTITEINLGCNCNIAADIETFSTGLALNKSLQVLSMNNCNIGTAKFVILKDALVGKSELLELHLRDNKIDDSGCRYVVELLTGCPSLQVLDLTWNNIESAGIRVITAALPLARNLRKLVLYESSMVDDETSHALLVAVKAHPNLSYICANGIPDMLKK
jgi:Ran GTPase-activating protein (RanGAP) involved in mRNA processing and transport